MNEGPEKDKTPDRKFYNGQIVYVLDKESLTPDGELTIRKATIFETKSAQGQMLTNPYVRIWEHPGKEPSRDDRAVEMSTLAIFTDKEMLEILGLDPQSLSPDTENVIDEMIADMGKSRDLTDKLGSALARLAGSLTETTQQAELQKTDTTPSKRRTDLRKW